MFKDIDETVGKAILYIKLKDKKIAHRVRIYKISSVLLSLLILLSCWRCGGAEWKEDTGAQVRISLVLLLEVT